MDELATAVKYRRLGGIDVVGTACLEDEAVSEPVGDRFFWDLEDD